MKNSKKNKKKDFIKDFDELEKEIQIKKKKAKLKPLEKKKNNRFLDELYDED